MACRVHRRSGNQGPVEPGADYPDPKQKPKAKKLLKEGWEQRLEKEAKHLYHAELTHRQSRLWAAPGPHSRNEKNIAAPFMPSTERQHRFGGRRMSLMPFSHRF
jgi:hypothetical protein